MGFLKIRCKSCGQSWEVYHRDDWKDDRARQCPHCFAEINKNIWEKSIIPGFASLSDANRELWNDYTGLLTRQMFTVDYIANRELLK